MTTTIIIFSAIFIVTFAILRVVGVKRGAAVVLAVAVAGTWAYILSEVVPVVAWLYVLGD